MKFLMDEHIPPLYRMQLRRREPSLTVWAVGDVGAPTRGTLDPDILRWCETNDFLLITNNRKSMPRHVADHIAAGGHIPGILQLDLDAPIGQAIEDLILLAIASQPGEYRDRFEYIPLK